MYNIDVYTAVYGDSDRIHELSFSLIYMYTCICGGVVLRLVVCLYR